MNKWYKILFLVLIAYNMFYDSTMLFKTTVNENLDKKEEINKRTIADKLIKNLVLFFFALGVLFIVFSKRIPQIITIIIIIIPATLTHFSSSVIAMDSLKTIIFENDTSKDLSFREKMQFDVFVSGLLMVNQYVPMSKVVSFFEIRITPKVNYEIVTSVYILVYVFLITFILLIELIMPLRHIKKMLEFIASKFSKSSRKLALYFFKIYDDPLLKARLTNKVIYILIRKKGAIKVVFFCLIIGTFLIDLVSNCMLMIYAFMGWSCLGTCIEFFRILGKSILKLLSLITEIPGHRVMKNTFRIAGIVAVFAVVIINRMNVFFVPDEFFIAITEFFASTIIIPVIFEWIYSGSEVKHNEIK